MLALAQQNVQKKRFIGLAHVIDSDKDFATNIFNYKIVINPRRRPHHVLTKKRKNDRRQPSRC